MKTAACAILLAGALTVIGLPAGASDGCAAYGDEKTDFTWRLCPGGEKYERQYGYFGIWSSFYRVSSATGACTWAASRSTWVCPDRIIRCDAKTCSAS
jgi:hypothetical protein